MKRLIYILAIFAITAGSLGFRADDKTEGGRRIALIVAIADYKNQYGSAEQWGHLSSLTDDTIITEALMKQGFDSIIHVRNEQATIGGIRKAFGQLTAMTKPGDMVYIHFSCHGQQIWDDSGALNGDELDGLDECIVTYDAPMWYHAGYKGEKHLRDDELGSLVNRVRHAAGETGDVWVVNDACHSGTTLRDGTITRGDKSAITPPGFDPNKIVQSNDGSMDEFTVSSDKLAPVVLFTACRAHEPNQEYRGRGSLSFAITQALPLIKTGESYRALFAYVNNEMAKMKGLMQVPTAEGDLNHQVFGGKEVKQANYYSVRFVKTGILVVDGGTLNGLFVGSKIAVMPAGSTNYDPAKAIYEGTVTGAEMSKAIIGLNKDLGAYSPKQLWVFITEQAFGAEHVKVGFGNNISGKIKNDIKKNIQLLSYVEWDERTPELLVDKDKDKYILRTVDGRSPFEAQQDYHALNTQINDYMQGKIMGEASFSDPDLKVELEFIPSHFNGYDPGTGEAIITDVNMESRLINGAWEIIDDDVMKMKLTNTGKKDAYVNILEIDPTGKVSVVLPDYSNDENPADFMLPAGKSIVVSDFVRLFTGPGYGKYLYKVFATDVPVNFRGIFNSRGPKADETYQHPAAKLFGQTFSSTRDGSNLSVKKTSGGGTTTEYTLRLNPRKNN